MIEGSCHCGAVRLTLPEPPPDLGSCNCSLCRRIGGLWGYYRPDQVAVHDPDAQLAGYVQGDATLTCWHCARSEEHTSELQSLMRISYAVFCLKKQNNFSPLTFHHFS